MLIAPTRIVATGASTRTAARAARRGTWPARNSGQNLADLRAQLAANARGARELDARPHDPRARRRCSPTCGHVQDNAEACVRRAIRRLRDGRFRYELDDGQAIEVAHRRRRDRGSGRRRLHGHVAAAGEQLQCAARGDGGRRALRVPHAGRRADPAQRRLPATRSRSSCRRGSMLDPAPPAAVVAGNVETSQCIVDALYGALGLQAAAQGTMNNFTFGNERYQYYETIAGGAGAGPGLRRRERRADAHDQLAPHRSGGARDAVSRCCCASSRSGAARAAQVAIAAATGSCDGSNSASR